VQSRRAYEKWCITGRQSIMDLLNKFWYSSLPPLGPRPRYPVEHIHADYTVLLSRLMKYVILPAMCRFVKKHLLGYGRILELESHHKGSCAPPLSSLMVDQEKVRAVELVL